MFRVKAPERQKAPECQDAQAGFTLVEVLVALAVAAICITAITLVSGGNARTVRSLEQRVALHQVARAVETGIPHRQDLALGRIDGELAGHPWRMDVRPLDVGEIPAGARWVPRNVLIRVAGPSGALLTVETVRLVPRSPE